MKTQFLKTVISFASLDLKMVVPSLLTLNTCLAFVVTPIPWFFISCLIRFWGAIVSRPLLLIFAKNGISATASPLYYFFSLDQVSWELMWFWDFCRSKAETIPKKLIANASFGGFFSFETIIFSNCKICTGIFYLLCSYSIAWLFFNK